MHPKTFQCNKRVFFQYVCIDTTYTTTSEGTVDPTSDESLPEDSLSTALPTSDSSISEPPDTTISITTADNNFTVNQDVTTVTNVTVVIETTAEITAAPIIGIEEENTAASSVLPIVTSSQNPVGSYETTTGSASSIYKCQHFSIYLAQCLFTLLLILYTKNIT